MSEEALELTEKEVTVDEKFSGMRMDRFLSESMPAYSRTYLQSLLRDGFVSVNGRAVKSSRKTETGDIVLVKIPPLKELTASPEDLPLDILYEDEDVLIINKEKGMTVHPAPGSTEHTLVNGILFHCRENLSGINGVLRPGIVHRIDKNTTGALIVCKNDRAHRLIAEQLKEHSITRVYHGIVTGNLTDDDGTVTGNIGRSSRDRKKMAVVRDGGKEAVTHYHVLKRFGAYTYCSFRLETGRTHQIRVHMASLGHPLLGDDVYGPDANPFHLTGQTLHAMVIGFIHPTTNKYMEFTAPLPEYFQSLLETLERRHLHGGI
jgi:23S rRNA pseudouridine1911/1915/1917 synthase